MYCYFLNSRDPTCCTRLQIRHPQSVALRQIHWVYSLSDRVNDCLVRRQVARWIVRQADGSLHNGIAVELNRVTKLVLADTAPVAVHQPEHHLVSDKQSQCVLKLMLRFRQAPCNRHD